jgi:uncharacterized protein (TIGR03435 family)
MEAIMMNRVGSRLNVGTKVALAAAAMTVLILPVVVGAMSPVAQVRGESAPRFEVASIKLNTTATIPLSAAHLAFLRGAGAGNARDGRFRAVGDLAAMPVSVLIQIAYNVNDLQLEGGPSWVRSDRYEVDARAEGSATLEQMRPMLQSLLADRFKLTLRRETRQLPVYDLLPDRGGLKIMPMKEGSCLPADHAIPFGPLNTCGGLRRQRAPERHVLEAIGIPMTKLVELLSDDVGRVVIDKTGLTNLFSFRLEFAPVALQVAPADSSVPPLFGALQEQLGLRLEAARAPVEVLVIESVERPTPN